MHKLPAADDEVSGRGRADERADRRPVPAAEPAADEDPGDQTQQYPRTREPRTVPFRPVGPAPGYRRVADLEGGSLPARRAVGEMVRGADDPYRPVGRDAEPDQHRTKERVPRARGVRARGTHLVPDGDRAAPHVPDRVERVAGLLEAVQQRQVGVRVDVQDRHPERHAHPPPPRGRWLSRGYRIGTPGESPLSGTGQGRTASGWKGSHPRVPSVGGGHVRIGSPAPPATRTGRRPMSRRRWPTTSDPPVPGPRPRLRRLGIAGLAVTLALTGGIVATASPAAYAATPTAGQPVPPPPPGGDGGQRGTGQSTSGPMYEVPNEEWERPTEGGINGVGARAAPKLNSFNPYENLWTGTGAPIEPTSPAPDSIPGHPDPAHCVTIAIVCKALWDKFRGRMPGPPANPPMPEASAGTPDQPNPYNGFPEPGDLAGRSGASGPVAGDPTAGTGEPGASTSADTASTVLRAGRIVAGGLAASLIYCGLNCVADESAQQNLQEQQLAHQQYLESYATPMGVPIEVVDGKPDYTAHNGMDMPDGPLPDPDASTGDPAGPAPGSLVPTGPGGAVEPAPAGLADPAPVADPAPAGQVADPAAAVPAGPAPGSLVPTGPGGAVEPAPAGLVEPAPAAPVADPAPADPAPADPAAADPAAAVPAGPAPGSMVPTGPGGAVEPAPAGLTDPAPAAPVADPAAPAPAPPAPAAPAPAPPAPAAPAPPAPAAPAPPAPAAPVPPAG